MDQILNPFDQINPFDQLKPSGNSNYQVFKKFITPIKEKESLIEIGKLLEKRLKEL